MVKVPSRMHRPTSHAVGRGVTPSAQLFSPPCRLRLDGENQSEVSCEILELSPEGVNVVMMGHQLVHQGQHGRLVIGSPEGDHYELPVDVRWVKLASSLSVLGLNLPTPPHWRFARS